MNRHQRRTLSSLKRRGLTKGLTLPRTEEDIKQDYANACAQAGEIQYQISQLEGVLKNINTQIEGLNKEARALRAAQPAPEAPKAEEASAAQA